MIRQKATSILFCLAAGVLAVSAFWGNINHTALAQSEIGQDKIQVFITILETLQRNYVEERSTNELLEAAIHGMLADLDPHTNYLPPDNFKRWNQSFEGFSGIGILFDTVGPYPMITGFVADSPASRSGLQSGDMILKINGTSTQGLATNEIMQLVSDYGSETINLTVFDRAKSKSRVVHLRKTHLEMRSIAGAFMLDPVTGYVELDRFNSSTVSELDAALDHLLDLGMQYLVLDLRDNGGGYLSAAVEVTDRFLPKGKLIVYTKGRQSHSYQEYYSMANSRYESLPLVILVNHGTASAAEIVAGALQDWDRALIVGATSFGKGLVQSQFRFRDGSALLVTTARYYTPLGRLIQRDYYNRSKDQYYAEAYIEDTGEWSPNRRGNRPFKTPKGRTVYGGGGITPDIKSSNDDAEISDELRRLYLDEGKYFYRFATKLIQEKPWLRRLKPAECGNIQISQKELTDFYQMLRNMGYNLAPETFSHNAGDISFLLERDTAYLVAGDEGRFQVNLKRDSQLLVAYANREKARNLLQSLSIAKVYNNADNSSK